jgi:DNA-binding YbaB/EbfC family protein
MKDLMDLMKQAQAVQEKMAEAQQKLADSEVSGEAGAGLVKVVLTAKGDCKSVSIDPSLFDPSEPEIVEDLIVAAHSDARRKAEAVQQDMLRDAAGGLQLPPGMPTPF